LGLRAAEKQKGNQIGCRAFYKQVIPNGITAVPSACEGDDGFVTETRDGGTGSPLPRRTMAEKNDQLLSAHILKNETLVITYFIPFEESDILFAKR
jgi:hypothetical protein